MSDEIEGEDLNPILDAIDAAEEIPDPLDGLVEKSAEDPGAAFTPEVLDRLVALKAEDRAAFEALRAEAQEGRMPGDGARRGHGRGKRGWWARSDAGRHPDRPCGRG